MLFQASGCKVLFIVLLHVMQVSSIQQTLRTVQVELCEFLTMLREKFDCTERSPDTLCM